MADPPIRPGTVRNSGDPIAFTGFESIGVAVSIGFPDEDVEVATQLAITSDYYGFSSTAGSYATTLEALLAASGHQIRIASAHWVVAIIRPDGSGQLYFDTAAVSVQARIKRAFEAGSPILSTDIADLVSVSFPCIEFLPNDRVIVFLRENWRFAFLLDLSGELDQPKMERMLGQLLCQLRYQSVFATLDSPVRQERMFAEGWFPFIEIFDSEFPLIVPGLFGEERFDRINRLIATRFDSVRINGIYDRWASNQYFAKRADVLRPGIDAYLAGVAVTSIKTLMTEIEGIIRDAHLAVKQQSEKIPGLLAFTTEQAGRKAGGMDTMFLPAEFQQYLLKVIYPNFDPATVPASASRHAVGHGAAPPASYTLTRALQVILTLDQLFWYL